MHRSTKQISLHSNSGGGEARQNIGGGEWYGYQAEQGRGRPGLLQCCGQSGCQASLEAGGSERGRAVPGARVF